VYNTDAVLFGAIGDQKYDNDPEAKLTGARIVEIEKELVFCKYQTYIFNVIRLFSFEIIEGADFIIF
jgi:hypothetical protein